MDLLHGHGSVDDHLEDEEVWFTIEVKEEMSWLKGWDLEQGNISVTFIVYNVLKSLAPRNIVKICFLPFIDKIDLKCKKYIAYSAIAPNMSMHAKNQINQ